MTSWWKDRLAMYFPGGPENGDVEEVKTGYPSSDKGHLSGGPENDELVEG